MNPWLQRARARLVETARRLPELIQRLPRAVRLGRFGTWSTVTVGVAVGILLLFLALLSYTGVQLARFERTDARRTMVVYAAPQPLVAGLNVKRVDLAATLGRLRYAEVSGTPTAPAQFSRTPGAWDIYLRGNDVHDGGSPRLVRLELRGGRGARVTPERRERRRESAAGAARARRRARGARDAERPRRRRRGPRARDAHDGRRSPGRGVPAGAAPRRGPRPDPRPGRPPQPPP